MLSNLVHNLDSIGKSTELYSSPDGSNVLVLPYGGRVLGLFAPHSEENFLWTHPALDSVESAKAFYEDAAWHNSGGDRTWLAPEVDFFLPNYPDLSFDGYWQPRQLDPGNYRLRREGDKSVLVNRLVISSSRLKLNAALEITKWVGPALNPVRYEPAWKQFPEVEYAGYTLQTSLRFAEAEECSSLQVGLWNLLQLPHGGELLVPTYGRADAKLYFGAIGSEDLVITDHLIRYRMRAPGEQKLGFRAVDTTGRVGYLYHLGAKSALVVRNFIVNPSGEYVDVPWSETANVGYSTQTCSVNSALGSFSELEYHVPAIGPGTGCDRSDDVSQVWAFRGNEMSMQSLARLLLSPEI